MLQMIFSLSVLQIIFGFEKAKLRQVESKHFTPSHPGSKRSKSPNVQGSQGPGVPRTKISQSHIQIRACFNSKSLNQIFFEVHSFSLSSLRA